MDNVCNRRLFSIPSKVEMAKEQEYIDKFQSNRRLRFLARPDLSKKIIL